MCNVQQIIYFSRTLKWKDQTGDKYVAFWIRKYMYTVFRAINLEGLLHWSPRWQIAMWKWVYYRKLPLRGSPDVATTDITQCRFQLLWTPHFKPVGTWRGPQKSEEWESAPVPSALRRGLIPHRCGNTDEKTWDEGEDGMSVCVRSCWMHQWALSLEPDRLTLL